MGLPLALLPFDDDLMSNIAKDNALAARNQRAGREGDASLFKLASQLRVLR